jgi:hypothetical protein
MIPQELIDRLKKDCEWLAKEQKNKFWISRTIDDKQWIFQPYNSLDLYIRYDDKRLFIEPDPLCEYPNALHRIVKEATGREIEWRYMEGGTISYFLSAPEEDVFCVDTDYRFPLHAEIEATCIAIEGVMK